MTVCACDRRIVTNLQRTLSEHSRPSKELLLQPLPLDLSQATYGKEFKRTLSCATGSHSSSEQAPTSLPALPVGGVPAGPGAPSLPAAFPATPTGAARNMQHAHLGFGEDKPRSNSVCGTGGTSRLSGLSISGSADSSSSGGLLSPSSLSVQRSSGSGSGHQLGQLRDIQAALGDYKRPEAAAGLSVSLPSPKTSFTGGSANHLSHLHPAPLVPAAPVSPSSNGSAAAGPLSPSKSIPARNSAAGSPLRPGLSLKVTLPPETDFELCGSSDSLCFSPNTPGPKAGIKERMKFYFQRQAGAGGGF